MRERVIRVVVVDGRELFRRGVAMLLQATEEFEVVAHGATVADVAGVAVPVDVVLLDATSPGLVACQELQQAHQRARVLVLTDADDADPFAAMAAGALGLLHKDSSLPELVQGIRVVADGQTLVSPSMTARLVGDLQQRGDAGRNGASQLTAREFEVLRLVSAGLSNREIGEHLGIAENTAKNHVRNMLEKLNLRTRTEAAMYAVREKLVEP